MARKSKPSPKLIIHESLGEISPYDLEGDVQGIQDRFSVWVEQYGPTIKISWEPDNWEPYSDSPTPIYRITREREETDEEFTQRLDKIAVQEAEQHARELAEYNRLKLKIEGKK